MMSSTSKAETIKARVTLDAATYTQLRLKAADWGPRKTVSDVIRSAVADLIERPAPTP